MLKPIKTFFYPNQSVFNYDSNKESIVAKLNGVFNRDSDLFDFNNLDGEFVNQDAFVFRMKSAAYTSGLIRNLSMMGTIDQLENGTTEIMLKVKPNYAWHLLFLVFVVFGGFYLAKSLINGSVTYTLLSCLMLVGGPILCVGLYNLQIEAIKSNYLKYIDKELRSN